MFFSCDGIGGQFLKLSAKRNECIYDDLFNAARAAGPDTLDARLHQLAMAFNTNLPEIYLAQPDDLHVYTSRLGGCFDVYPNDRETFKKILCWTLAPP
jgi:hypothetical protein